MSFGSQISNICAGMDSRDQAGTFGEGRQDQVLGGDLPLLSAHQGSFTCFIVIKLCPDELFTRRSSEESFCSQPVS